MRLASLLAAWMLIGCSEDAAPPDDDGAGGGGGAPQMLECSATEVIVGDICVPVGVGECGEGFTPDDRGGCTPILPAEACAPGEVALLGETSCRPLVPCGTSQWGDAPIEATTEFVDASFMGTSDGSQTAPWRTVTEATDVAAPGAVVAIAAGTYLENDLSLVRPARLWGRCPSMVSIEGTVGNAAVAMFIGADNSEVHDLGVTGAGDGIIAADVENVIIEGVWVHDTNNIIGIAVIDPNYPASATLRDVLVESAQTLGILGAGTELIVDRTVVRTTKPDGLDRAGAGIGGVVSPSTQIGPTYTITRSIVHDVRAAGMSFEASHVSIADSLVKNVLPQLIDGEDGYALVISGHAPTQQASTLDVTRSVFVQAHEAGVMVSGSNALMSDVTVQDVAAQEAAPHNGVGVVAQQYGNLRATLTLERALVERAFTAGVMVLGSDGIVRQSIVRDSEESDGLVAFAPTSVTSAVVGSSRIEGHPRAGVSSFGATLALEATTFECNLFDIAIEPWNNVDPTANDLGQNHCGCGTEELPCKALSQNLSPPDVSF